jgi:hypothetical protein
MSLFDQEGLEDFFGTFPFRDDVNTTIDSTLDRCPSPACLDTADSSLADMHEFSDLDQASTTDPLLVAHSAPSPAIPGLTEQMLLDHNLAFASVRQDDASPTKTKTSASSAVPVVRSATMKKTRRAPPKKERQKAQLTTLAARQRELLQHRQVGHSVVEDVLRVLHMMAADRKL